MTQPLCYYITAHGYGHGVRSCDILRALHQADTRRPLYVISDLPGDFLRNRLPGVPFQLRRGAFDVGMVQLDSVRVDLPATKRQALTLLQARERLIAEEQSFLKSIAADIVVADIPSIPLEAAARAGIARAAVGNFGWDWIYAPFAEQDSAWREMIALYETGYSQTNLLLRLPFAEPMAAFPHRIDIPVVATPGQPCRQQIATLTGAPLDRQWVLLSFSTLDWNDAALDRICQLDDYAFFTMHPLAWSRSNIFPVHRTDVPFNDLIASVDLVCTKPGFGVLSDCVVNDVPIVYVDRQDFREYPVLEQAIHRYLRHAHIPASDLYAGHLGPALEHVQQAPAPPGRVATGGADQAANILLSLQV